ncbi:MAG: hypothetical protein ACREFY_15675 [Acetobacteraceae bacterium]
MTARNDRVIPVGFDWLSDRPATEGAQAIATRRRRILAEAADQRLAVAGRHLDFPSFGHVVGAGAGAAFVPHVRSPVP